MCVSFSLLSSLLSPYLPQPPPPPPPPHLSRCVCVCVCVRVCMCVCCMCVCPLYCFPTSTFCLSPPPTHPPLQMSFSEAGPSGLCHIASSASSSRSSSSESSDQNGVKRLRVGSECVVEATSREGRRGITRTARQSRGEERAAAR